MVITKEEANVMYLKSISYLLINYCPSFSKASYLAVDT